MISFHSLQASNDRFTIPYPCAWSVSAPMTVCILSFQSLDCLRDQWPDFTAFMIVRRPVSNGGISMFFCTISFQRLYSFASVNPSAFLVGGFYAQPGVPFRMVWSGVLCQMATSSFTCRWISARAGLDGCQDEYRIIGRRRETMAWPRLFFSNLATLKMRWFSSPITFHLGKPW